MKLQSSPSDLREERVNLDTTPTMNWLAGQAIASHRPQVRATEDDTGIIEAALPIIQNTPDNGGRVLGVIDLFAVSRVKRQPAWAFLYSHNF